MRILMVTEDVPAPQVGGLGKHVVTLSNALIAQGHQVALLGRSDVSYEANRAEIGFNGEFIPGFSLARRGWKESQLGVWLPYKRLVLARRIAKAIERHMERFDVVHYHGHLPMVGLTLPEQLNFVQTRHDQGSECITHLRFKNGEVCNTTDPADCAGCAHASPGVLRRFVSESAVRQYRNTTRLTFESRKTIFVSEFLRRQFLRAVPHARMDRTWAVHNFIDLARLQHIAAQANDPPCQSLLLVGRMDAAKGFGAFLESISRLRSGKVPITVVGDGTERASLQQQYQDAGVRFLGWQPLDVVIALTRAAHTCVVPSICQEPCGTTVLESLVLGRPCLALRRGGTPELARYQLFPGQLGLFETMDELAARAVDALRQPFVAHSPAISSEADITFQIPRILDIYMA